MLVGEIMDLSIGFEAVINGTGNVLLTTVPVSNGERGMWQIMISCVDDTTAALGANKFKILEFSKTLAGVLTVSLPNLWAGVVSTGFTAADIVATNVNNNINLSMVGITGKTIKYRVRITKNTCSFNEIMPFN